VRRFWRTCVRPAWREVRAPLALAAAILVIVLGTIGFNQEPGYNWWEAFFKSFQLFGFAGGDVNSDSPLSLNIARVLAPLLVGYAAIRGLVALSREQLRLLGFRLFRRNHAVVAGLGDVGFRLADVVNELGGRVIGVDSNPTNPSFEGCRERGISVLAGDATDPDTLRAACADRAAYLIVAPGTDAVTVDVVAAAERITADRRGEPLRVMAHVESRGLWSALAARSLSSAPHRPTKLEPFNLYESAGRLIVAEHPPVPGGSDGARRAPRVLVVSDQPIGEILVVNIARIWRRVRTRSRARIRIDFAGPEAEAACEGMLARQPALGRFCDLEPWEIDPASPAMRDDARVSEASAVYVAVGDEATGLASALLLSGACSDASEVVLVTNDERLGAANVAAETPGAGAISVFGILSRTLTRDFLSSGVTEIIARAMHESYVRDQLAKGETRETLPYLLPWEELSEDARRANRDFATGVAANLEEAGFAVVPRAVVDLDQAHSFDEAEIERLAELEHERWKRDKEAAGWRYGPERDDDTRIHPSLVPYEELPASEKDKDRTAMRDLRQMLAEAGFAIERI
jgi:voltage-gated potassium channel Kch